ncbi:MAG: P-II family nitrogen regulator [Chloroflexi bacterium]|nr:P-II family nitrogen regulator [Chloroflexota bacterium]
MNKIEAIIRPEKLETLKNALAEAGFFGLNVVNVTGRGIQRGITYVGRTGEKHSIDMLPKVKLELVVREADTEKVIEIIVANSRTGEIGDGKIFVAPITEVIRVRTGERGEEAL